MNQKKIDWRNVRPEKITKQDIENTKYEHFPSDFPGNACRIVKEILDRYNEYNGSNFFMDLKIDNIRAIKEDGVLEYTIGWAIVTFRKVMGLL